MNNNFKALSTLVASASLFIISAHADTPSDGPNIQAEGPIIYLKDNLDEQANLGWCIDTEGKGFSDQLQAHSCKPEGYDTLYYYDEPSSMVQSVEFVEKCMAFNAPENAVNPFGLVDCAEDDMSQKFIYDKDSMEIRIFTDEATCVTVAETIIEAGPYQSRDLIAAPCKDLDASFKQWTVVR